MKKKYLSLFMSVILAVSSVVAFSGCGNADKGNKTDGQNTESSDEQVTLRFMWWGMMSDIRLLWM